MNTRKLIKILLSPSKYQQVEFKGISGQIEFKEGQRNTFKLDLIKLKQNFFVKCGEWSNPSGLNITDYDSLFEGNQMNTTSVLFSLFALLQF